ncbi:universal stress protein [Variovorax sp. J22R133]|uniref:universal stress protein n=1 Tax=Variovorax brevis TaxID=3053503 RepID=UPI002577C542|nr:universal stress protein [Variovorax sp. J22R133]MDM0114012.1 universal stress protein [Variovorax sp. J22R133]
MFKHILVATDGSALATRAVASAIELASVHGAQLLVLTVVPVYPESNFVGGSAIFDAKDMGRIEQGLAQDAQALMEQAAQSAADRGVKAGTVVMHSDAVGETIIAAARKHQCDLIVMASHGRKGIKRLLLGSETQRVLSRAQIPVLVLR